MTKKCLDVETLRKEYGKIFREAFMEDPWYDKVLEIGRRNVDGGLYLIGGYVHRSIIKKLYGTDFPEGIVDFDFASEMLSRTPYAPRGWKHRRTSFGNPCLETEGCKVDLNGLNNFKDVGSPTIHELIRIAPMDVQMLAWNCEEEELVCDPHYKAIQAIDSKKLRVNRLDRLKTIALHREDESTARSILEERAKSLGFRAVYEDANGLRKKGKSKRGLGLCERRNRYSLPQV
ncbi:MAG: hypothetical protein KKC19_01740 [Nanoarchaeota archaeon]|nr:hypothetical protein [Nanoarchaeota archaeon]